MSYTSAHTGADIDLSVTQSQSGTLSDGTDSTTASELRTFLDDPPTGIIGEVRYGFWSSSPDPDRWILCYGSIGSASSGADNAASKYEALFTHLWDTLSDTYAPVSTGRGASAAADFAANKTLTMPDSRGRSPMGAGTGGGLTARTLGDTIGEEDHANAEAENATHDHDYTTGSGGGTDINTTSPTAAWDTLTTTTSGSGSPHNTVQPSVIVQAIIRY